MKEITLKGTIDEELDDEIIYRYDLKQVKDLKWFDFGYCNEILYLCIKKEEKKQLKKPNKPMLDGIVYPTMRRT